MPVSLEKRTKRSGGLRIARLGFVQSPTYGVYGVIRWAVTDNILSTVTRQLPDVAHGHDLSDMIQAGIR